jgi:hypothetical protein
MKTLLIAAFLMGLPEQVQLHVTVYDGSGLPRELRSRMFAEAGRILRAAGVNVVWVEGDPANPQASLIQYPGDTSER